jgi:hypothetical protein
MALPSFYEELLELALSPGRDVRACPGTTIVPVYGGHVFAQIKASTSTRINLGLALGNTKTPKRLVDTGGFEKKDRITRRIEVKSKTGIADELKYSIGKAYQADQ